MRISPKSGSPVFGQTDVNSGQLMWISYSRSGYGFGNVSIVELDMRPNSSILLRKTAVSAAGAIDTGGKGALGYGGFVLKTAIVLRARRSTGDIQRVK
jgi:hypothetical protein